MRVLVRKLRSGFRQPAFVLLWLAPVWLLLGLCRVLIRLVSFRRLASLLGVPHGTCASVPLASRSQQQRAAKIGRVVRLAARHAPWELNCYPRSLTACVLLRLYRIPHCLCFGVAQDPAASGFSAHAWTAAGSVRVTGGESFGRYTVLACFVSLPGGADRQVVQQD